VNVLETERLNLRLLSIDDAGFILELLNEPSFIRNIGDKGVRTLPDARRYILDGPVASYQRYGFGLYVVALKESGQPIGLCGLVKRESLSDVDIGFAFLPEYWSRGYALESAAAVKAYGHEVLGLERLVAITNPENEGSIRVLEKIGLKYQRLVQLSEDGPWIRLYASDAETPLSNDDEKN
jgi:RimJ/RimL family protein N-acetyltransferase